ncbi:hypothetical protein Leryth_025543 [Lithospermum erythrorhizon]|uniref:Phytocyanin domain-containing protein n=1 Tax=Lithospermum erythrorhizon TaxID=34254 RepID=A0AAV3S2F0_LITER|nr:hypothetical protein Leryth_025543 [Lithospermum erythrorhizon]
MASLNSMVAVLSVALLFASAMAVEHWVGDSSGWTIDFDYKTWASKRTFYLGDTLVFNYTQGNHNVYKVDAAGFTACNIPNDAPLQSGHDVITLKTSGKKWYICGVNKHCIDHNQRLAINVLDISAPAPAPSSAHLINFNYQILVAAAIGALALVFIY